MSETATCSNSSLFSTFLTGIKLSAPNGKNDGSVNNVRYFECEPRYGLFTRREFLRPVTESAESTPKKVANAQASSGIPGTPATNPSSGVQRVGGVSSAETPLTRPGGGGGGLQVGDRVQVSGSRVGTVRFIGPTDFAAGDWVGIELDDPLGKNDGSVMGRRYFTCKPNHGLFSAPSKITPFSGKTPTRPLRRTGSRESLLSLGSNFSSVSRQRPKQGAQPRRTPIQGSFSGPSVHALESVVKEKEAHIEQLLQEFEMERNELAKVTAEREMIEMEAVNQRSLIGQLHSQIEELQAAALQLSDENARLKGRVHEEVKKSEELQFRLEEEAIEKTSLENQKSDVEERIFELEEALAAAKEVNERIEAQLRENGADATTSDLPPVDSRLVAAEARAAELEATLKKLQEEQLSVCGVLLVGTKVALITYFSLKSWMLSAFRENIGEHRLKSIWANTGKRVMSNRCHYLASEPCLARPLRQIVLMQRDFCAMQCCVIVIDDDQTADAQKQVGAKDAEIRDLRAQLASLQDSLLKAEQKLVEKTSMESSRGEELKVVQASEKELTAAFNQQQAVLSAEAEKLRSEEVNALVCKLAQTESELEAMRTKVKELESQIVAFGENQTKPVESPAGEDKPASNKTLDPDALLDELQNHVNKVKETDAKESEEWSKRLLEVAEEVRKLKGVEREPDEATTRALQQMSIRLLEAEAELAQKEAVCLAFVEWRRGNMCFLSHPPLARSNLAIFGAARPNALVASSHTLSPSLSHVQSVSLAQMSALTEAHLHLKEKQEESPAQTLVTEELRKRLEVLEAERCQLSTTLSERQKEAASVSILLMELSAGMHKPDRSTYLMSLKKRDPHLFQLRDALSLKGTEVEACMAKIARLEKELSGAVSERDRKLNELKAAVSAHEALGLSDEELLERVSQLRKQKSLIVGRVVRLKSACVASTVAAPHDAPACVCCSEELERLYAASEARLQSLSSHHLQVDEEYQALKQSTAPMVSVSAFYGA
ncbi:unnamed protein product [Mesocestoides corti]|uniref:CAP-Gly domain-containing protein n=1 Tax=Mesocestoides corti TaxID=53468 RepID=A0A0R3U9P1_MESCO|nr:unnamed protein product [Mesocestoides corti]